MIVDRYRQLIEDLGDLRVKRAALLAPFTTFKVGGPADLLFAAHQTEDLIKAVRAAAQNQVAILVLGSGSNVIAGDRGFRGLVIINRCEGIRLAGYQGRLNRKGQQEKVVVEADGGTHLQRLKRWTIEQGLGGLEFVDGIPGTVGGAVKLNVHDRHRPKQERYLSDVLIGADLLSLTGEKRKVDPAYFEFDQKRRGWKMGSKLLETQEIVLNAKFSLQKTDPEKLWAYVREYAEWRRANQPQGLAGAGSFFTNPRPGLSAGQLIDQAGLKGAQVGGAIVSTKHANFMLNLGSASAADVVSLASKVKKKVRASFGIDLQEEIVYVGEF